MDRQIVYPGSIPLDTDLLNIQRNTMTAFGALARAVLGTSPVLDGLMCAPAAASGYSVVITPGSLTAQMPTDASSFGSLPSDQNLMVKTGSIDDNYTLQLNTWPDTSMVLCWLVQATLLELDANPVALPYWNAANPAVPYSGPSNSGAAQNTKRQVQLTFGVKSSGPVPVGTYAPPTEDLGWVPLYGVTTWAGKAGIDQEDISSIVGAPFLPFHLPDLAPGFSRQELFTGSTGWSVPAGVKRVRVRLVGGGGGGGGGSTIFGGGGGGAGGYAEAVLAVLPGQSYPIAIGAGGASGVPGATAGSGGTTAFGTVVSASGGQGGASSNPDSHGGSGGAGLQGSLLQFGGYGGDGPMIGGVPAGNGGSSAFGGGGRGANQGGPPADGKAAGSGAGGGYGANALGGNGAGGLVVVEY